MRGLKIFFGFLLDARFEVEELGSGSYGNVFKAMDKKTSQVVAVKLMERGENIKSMDPAAALFATCSS